MKMLDGRCSMEGMLSADMIYRYILQFSKVARR